MTKIFTALFLIVCMLSLGACAVKNTPASFTTLPPITTQGDEAWEILIETVSNYYPGIEVANKKTGQVSSIGKVTDTCWAGLMFGGFVPCEFDKFVGNVKSFNPFEVNISVEKYKATTMSNYRQWYAAGNLFEKERIIYNHLLSNLNAQFKTPVEINGGRDLIIDMPSYSLEFNDYKGWKIKQRDTEFEKTTITKINKSTEYKILIMKNLILDESRQKSNASTLASDYIDFEIKNMEELGVKGGMYKLENISRGKEAIGEKLFYSLNYSQISPAGLQNNTMYLYIPNSQNNKVFLIMHCSEFSPKGNMTNGNYKAKCIETIQKLKVK